TNSFGCTTTSASINIFKSCSTPTPPCVDEEVTLTGEWVECSKIKLTAEYSNSPLSVKFIKNVGFTNDHAEGQTPEDNNNIYTQEFEVNASGRYKFAYVADYGTCEVSGLIEVQVDYQLEMGKKTECHPDGYKVSILNLSSYYEEGDMPTPEYTFKKLPNGPVVTPEEENVEEAIA